MCTIAEHLDQVHTNILFYRDIDKKKFSDWAVTVLFYSALHAVDMLLAAKRENPKSHRDRTKIAARYLVTTYADFAYLYNKSRESRYDHIRFTPNDIASMEQKRDSIFAEVNQTVPFNPFVLVSCP